MVKLSGAGHGKVINLCTNFISFTSYRPYYSAYDRSRMRNLLQGPNYRISSFIASVNLVLCT